MRKAGALLAALLLSACAPLRSEPLAEIGPPEFARVVAKRDLDVRSGETRAERAACGLARIVEVRDATTNISIRIEWLPQDDRYVFVQEYDPSATFQAKILYDATGNIVGSAYLIRTAGVVTGVDFDGDGTDDSAAVGGLDVASLHWTIARPPRSGSANDNEFVATAAA